LSRIAGWFSHHRFAALIAERCDVGIGRTAVIAKHEILQARDDDNLVSRILSVCFVFSAISAPGGFPRIAWHRSILAVHRLL
jgi:hypothetical protein